MLAKKINIDRLLLNNLTSTENKLNNYKCLGYTTVASVYFKPGSGLKWAQNSESAIKATSEANIHFAIKMI